MADGTAAEGAQWQRRFRMPRYTLAAWAKKAPERCVLISDVSGSAQVHCWDRRTGVVRQATDEQGGVQHCAIEASGKHVWWFQDTTGDELGTWLRQPFGGGVDEPVLAAVEPFWPAGLAMGIDDHVLLGRSTPDGTVISLLAPDGSCRQVYHHAEPAEAVDLSRDLQLILIAHSEGGDIWHPGMRVLRSDGSVAADLTPAGEALQPIGFCPIAGDDRVLVQQLVGNRWEPAIFSATTGRYELVPVDLSGELTVDWFQDGRSLLVLSDYRGRSRLHRLDLSTRVLQELETPPGTIEHVRTRPNGSVWYLWSNAAEPHTLNGLPEPMGFPSVQGADNTSVPVMDAWVPGQGGNIHALISLPADAQGPLPTVFLLHGGPDACDRDSFSPEVAAWVDHGFAVVRVNYRGSTGYGEAWKAALLGRVGLTELEDVAAVRRWTIDRGIADPNRLVLAGWSWGGFLTLLGLGTQPDDWAVGLAGAPVADCAAAYEAEMDDLRALDRTLFGGSPDEVPERYAISSPSSYVKSVRAPVLITAAGNDSRCPIVQIQAYAAQLEVPHRLHQLDGGHQLLNVATRTAVFETQLSFVREHLCLGVSSTPGAGLIQASE